MHVLFSGGSTQLHFTAHVFYTAHDKSKSLSSHISFPQLWQLCTCTGPASEARMASRVCPSVRIAPRGSRGLVSMELQSTCREAAPCWTLRATLCQRRSIRASTPSPLKTQFTSSAVPSDPLARRVRVPSAPLKSTENWRCEGWEGQRWKARVIWVMHE